jgi:hypothetical protein
MGSKSPKAAAAPRLTGQMAQLGAQNLYDLKQQATGKGPSVTADLLKANKERTLASQLSAAQGMRTRNVGGLQRQLAQQAGMANRAQAQGSAVGRVQEQQFAQNQIAGLAQGDLSRQSQMAQLEAQRRAQASASKNQLGGQVLGAVGTVVGGMYGGPAGASVGGAVGSAAGSGGLSDSRAKDNKKPASEKVNSFLDQLSKRQSESKVESGSEAQNGFMQVLAAQAEMHKRLKKMEE